MGIYRNKYSQLAMVRSFTSRRLRERLLAMKDHLLYSNKRPLLFFHWKKVVNAIKTDCRSAKYINFSPIFSQECHFRTLNCSTPGAYILTQKRSDTYVVHYHS